MYPAKKEPLKPKTRLSGLSINQALSASPLDKIIAQLQAKWRSVMEPYQWTILGLFFDVVGAFLVSVEAIKLDNIRRLRDLLMTPVSSRLTETRLGAVALAAAIEKNPSIGSEMTPLVQRLLRKHVEEETIRRGGSMGAAIQGLAINALTGAVTISILALLLRRAGVDLWSPIDRVAVSIPTLLLYLLAILAAPVLLFLLIIVGSSALTTVFAVPIRVLEFIDRRTPDGTIGIIGFGFLCLGFSLQAYAAWQTGRVR